MYFFMGSVLAEAVMALLLMRDGGLLHMIALKLVSTLKVGKGFTILRLLAAGTFINLASTIYGIYKIQRRIWKMGAPTSADHFIMRTYLLESFLMGSSLFLLMVIGQLHNQYDQLASLRLNVETMEKQSQAMQSKYLGLVAEKRDCAEKEHERVQEEMVSLKDLVADLRQKMEGLQLESLEKDKVVKSADANARALQKQSEGLLLEYDRLLDENQSLRSQLTSLDRRLSWSDGKKYA